MNSRGVCSQCLRILRQHPRVERSHTPNITLGQDATRSLRSLSSHSGSRLAQEQRQDHPDPGPYTQPPPFTTGTATSNVTAAPPEAAPTTTSQSPPSSSSSTAPVSKSKIPDLSTADMQRHLTSQLSRTRGSTLTDNLARTLRKTAKSTTESYITYGLTEAFFKSCSAQAPYTIPEDQRARVLTDKGPPKTVEGEDLGIALTSEDKDNGFWFREIGLPPTFSTWSQITYLHMYILTVRLRGLEDSKQFRDYQRYLIEHFSNAAEDKMLILHSMQARGIRNRYLKDLFVQWRGLLAAYDEGMIQGDAVLAGAIWRNLWKGREEVDWEKVAVVVAYMRRAIHILANVPLDELAQNLDTGRKVWESSRDNIMNVITLKSRGISEPV